MPNQVKRNAPTAFRCAIQIGALRQCASQGDDAAFFRSKTASKIPVVSSPHYQHPISLFLADNKWLTAATSQTGNQHGTFELEHVSIELYVLLEAGELQLDSLLLNLFKPLLSVP